MDVVRLIQIQTKKRRIGRGKYRVWEGGEPGKRIIVLEGLSKSFWHWFLSNKRWEWMDKIPMFQMRKPPQSYKNKTFGKIIVLFTVRCLSAANEKFEFLSFLRWLIIVLQPPLPLPPPSKESSSLLQIAFITREYYCAVQLIKSVQKKSSFWRQVLAWQVFTGRRKSL